ncbi:hypothetical protein A2U01_0074936, partial [Trifolium medium]|nr:hypothetical protein [Trifolium medium]
YSNVKDVNKLTKALNAVCFGNYCIHARVSRFDRFDKAERKSLRTEKGETKTAEADVIPMSQMKEGDEAAKGVRVGDVLVRLGGQKEKEGKAGDPEK